MCTGSQCENGSDNNRNYIVETVKRQKDYLKKVKPDCWMFSSCRISEDFNSRIIKSNPRFGGKILEAEEV